MTQALLAAELLGQYVARNAPATGDRLAEFDCERESLLRDYRRLTAVLLWLARNPAFLGVALEMMRRLPRVFSHLLGVAGGSRRLRGVGSQNGIPVPTVQREILSVLEQRSDRAA
jgi:hypothetical protein